MHTSVLLNEVLEYLDPQPGKNFIDATFNGGGHGTALAQRIVPNGRLIGIEWDINLAAEAKKKFAEGPYRDVVTVVNDSYVNIAGIAREHGMQPDGILFDLGLSSWHYESGRGFSFKSEEGLKMTFDPNQRPNAEEFINTANVRDLEEVIRKYGEERFAGRIARAIERYRARKRITSAKELSEIISRAVPRRGRINPATKTFQALRIYLNHELENIENGLRGAWKIIKPKGRIAVISYHSLEDRIVKNFFKEKAKNEEGKLINRKPIVPSREEVTKNPRSRSAKLRILEKL